MSLIKINDSIYLSPLTMDDCPALVEHLQDKEISDFTLSIPFPYQLSDAGWFVNFAEQQKQKFGYNRQWAIRKADGGLIGIIGFVGEDRRSSLSTEIGYWLGKKYWGIGIVPNCVNVLCNVAFKELKFVRVQAHVFDYNRASQRVLEKSGFELEGRLKKAYHKNGKIFDALLYARVV